MINIDKIISKEASVAVLGLGYVGLPIALAFAKKCKVIGFDINEARVEMMKNKQDPSGELESSDFEGSDIDFTARPIDLKGAKIFIVTVPTPIDAQRLPNLNPLLSATQTVAENMSDGAVVVYESTVYPGCTEEECVPILEKVSGLGYNRDFFVGFSPERINPGDKEHTLAKITKVISGSTEEATDLIKDIYELVVEAGIYKASSIKVAEAAKIIENTQRDLNIALMNELSLIFARMNINTYEVLEAAGTKWNFLKFHPGLVGGHCIGVDPYYLTYKSQKIGYDPQVILSGRRINDGMGAYVADQLIKALLQNKTELLKARVLIMGATFKENVEDIRNSKVIDILDRLNEFNVRFEVHDPYADPTEFKKEYGHELTKNIDGVYDAVLLAVPHQDYINLDVDFFNKILSKEKIFFDLKGIFRNLSHNYQYFSL